MSYHIVTIDSPTAYLNYEHGQFICVTDTGTQQLPLADIGAIVVCCFSAKIEMRLLTEAAKLGVGVILCECFKPECIVLPAQRSTDTELTRVWQKVPEKFLKELWQKTLDAKCHNQWALAKLWLPEHPAIADIGSQKFLRYRAREGTVSRLYWGVFRKKVNNEKFIRSRGKDLVNSFLDYGYSVLLARILQICFAYGLDPTYGIGHVSSERSTALAYDLMEPFRPLVDAKVMEWLARGKEELVLNKEFKQYLLSFLQERILYQGAEQQAQTVMEISIRSFRACLLQKKMEIYDPWMAVDSKWGGC